MLQLNEREVQQRIPPTVKLEFTDIRIATEVKKALATAIGFIRAGIIYIGYSYLINLFDYCE